MSQVVSSVDILSLYSFLSLADALVAFADRGRRELNPKPLGKKQRGYWNRKGNCPRMSETNTCNATKNPKGIGPGDPFLVVVASLKPQRELDPDVVF